MKELKQLSLEELDDLFRHATSAAKKVAKARGLPKVGLDQDGKLVESSEADHNSEADYEHGNVA